MMRWGTGNSMHGGGLCIYQNETSRCSDYFAENNLKCVERMISSRPFSIDTATRKELPPFVGHENGETCSADFSAYSRSLQSRFHPRQCVEIFKNFTTYPEPKPNMNSSSFERMHCKDFLAA